MATTKWALDPTHSELQFKVKHLMITTVTGNIKSFQAELSSEGDDFTNADELQIGTFSDKGDGVESYNALNLSAYPTTNRLEEVYEEAENRPQKYIDNISKSGTKGSNLHLILAEVNGVDEVENARLLPDAR